MGFRFGAALASGMGLLTLLVGCGTAATPYSAGATSECLDASVTIDYLGIDRLSKSAPDGAYRVDLDHNYAVLAFWGSTDAARDAVARLNRIATAARSGPDSRFTRLRNVSIAWQNAPARSDAASVERCLRS